MVQSDRYNNPQSKVCPVWNGIDNTGRPVNEHSMKIKSAGCNDPTDLITIENEKRPQYSLIITAHKDLASLSASNNTKAPGDKIPYASIIAANDLKNSTSNVGSYGMQAVSNVATSCGAYQYARGME
jgi:hypothetical protein